MTGSKRLEGREWGLIKSTECMLLPSHESRGPFVFVRKVKERERMHRCYSLTSKPKVITPFSHYRLSAVHKICSMRLRSGTLAKDRNSVGRSDESANNTTCPSGLGRVTQTSSKTSSKQALQPSQWSSIIGAFVRPTDRASVFGQRPWLLEKKVQHSLI